MRTTFALCLGLMACTTPIETDSLQERGTYGVGMTQVTVSYTPPGETEVRDIPVKVWYPITESGGASLVNYKVGGIVDVISEEVYEDASPAAGPFPVAVYSHGSGGEDLIGYPYGELFASHGWVVASPAHVGNTALDSFFGEPAPFERTLLRRPLDITATLNALEDGFDDAPFLDGLSDTSQTFLFGHSFGAYTTLATAGVPLNVDGLVQACQGDACAFYEDPAVREAFDGLADPRIDAIAPQAPAFIPSFAPGGLAGLDMPTLLMSARKDITTPDATQAIPAWEGLANADDVWVEMPNGGHMSFISICHDLEPSLLNTFSPGSDEDGCGPDFTPTTEAVPIIGAYMLAFAKAHVLGEQQWTGVFTQEPLHPEFEITLP